MPDQPPVTLYLSVAVADALIARSGIRRDERGRYVLPAEARALIHSRFGWTWAKDEAAMWAAEIVAVADLEVLS